MRVTCERFFDPTWLLMRVMVLWFTVLRISTSFPSLSLGQCLFLRPIRQGCGLRFYRIQHHVICVARTVSLWQAGASEHCPIQIRNAPDHLWTTATSVLLSLHGQVWWRWFCARGGHDISLQRSHFNIILRYVVPSAGFMVAMVLCSGWS